jgi:hypothetical protein
LEAEVTPTFQHDCDACRFLGTVTGPNPYHAGLPYVWDLYFCERSDGGSVIARHSDEGCEYLSTPVKLLSPSSHPALLWAYALVQMELRR